MTDASLERPSTPRLIGDAISQATSLFTAELNLIRLEATEKLVAALVAVVTIIVAAVFMIVALIFLLQGLVYFLVHLGWQPFVASLAVGGCIAIVAILAIILSARRFTAAKMMPARTIRQVAGTAEMVKGVTS